jgi:small-conductance mechanosensitive channel
VRISNSTVFTDPLFNYSRDLPFLWDEIVVSVRPDSDFVQVRKLLEEIADEIVGDYVKQAKVHWQSVKNKYLVEDETIDPVISLFVKSGSMEYTVRYPVDFKERQITKDRLFEAVLSRFSKREDIVLT